MLRVAAADIIGYMMLLIEAMSFLTKIIMTKSV